LGIVPVDAPLDPVVMVKPGADFAVLMDSVVPFDVMTTGRIAARL
jgi:hypothetical protein